MDLTAVTGKPTGLLSGGQRKRVQAATALIAERPLLLLDEPTVGADPVTRSRLLAVVRDRAAAGAAIVYTTHYLPELTELGATLAVAASGKVIARGTQHQLSLERVSALLGAADVPAASDGQDDGSREPGLEDRHGADAA
jgi:ABC-2 type transport system ATP-binding protein